MSKTIEQLAILAAQIEEATRQGENTALRVGGLFSDIVDYLATLHLNDITLGPLLTSLNNSGLLEPSDGQTLAFSIIDDKWKYSDAITQLKLSIRGIEQTVASNYRAFLQVKDELEAQVNATDQRVREYKTEYDQSQIEYTTWKSQTDTSISQYATAINKMTGDIISISGRVDTAYDQLDFVTNDLEAADKAIGKIFDLAGMNLSDEPSASWLYKNKDGIYGAAATFDADGNIKNLSKLSVTIDGISTEVRNVEGNVSSIKQAVDSIQLAVAADDRQIKTLSETINGSEGHPGILDRLGNAESGISGYAESASWIQQNRDSITATVGYFDSNGKLLSTAGLVTRGDYAGLFAQYYNATGVEERIGEMSISLEKKVDEDGVEHIISTSKIAADQVKFDTVDWTVTNKVTGDTIFHLDSGGNLAIAGKFSGEFDETVVFGKGTKKMYISPTVTGAQLIGKDNDYTTLSLGFNLIEGGYRPSLFMMSKNGYNNQDSLIRIQASPDFAEVLAEAAGSTGNYHTARLIASPRWGYSTIECNHWPRNPNMEGMTYGSVYVDENGFLKAKGL